ncbi:DNA-binding protein RHL1 isoform X7 [Gossypium hirsutum]|uniref:DNA-binding protein RHL1 isoform X7 n=1 Tax=Gossypium hirsutum TaxID=3635 RepID=A0ABM2YKS0_GOSHI|nr:DNA-binding protein RHL1 isoform X7 [Gossypium hirsutum]
MAKIFSGNLKGKTVSSSLSLVSLLLFPVARLGQMKLFGTIVYPKNRYLSLLFSRGGKNVMCDDYFDNMIVFSDAWWIGKKDENPDEVRLDFPKELFEGQQMEYDFKGGAGVTSINKQGIPRTEMKQADTESLDTESEDALSDDESNLKVKMEATPTRHSARNAGKRFKFAEASSEEDTVRSDAEPSDGEEKKVGLKLDFSDNDIVAKPITSAPLVLGSDDSEDNQVSKQIRTNLIPVTKSKKPTQTSVTVTKSKENSNTSHGSLVQATISTLFKKAEEKVMDHAFIFATELYNYSLGSWFGLSGKKSRCKKSEKKVGQVKLSLDKNDGSSKKGKVIKGRTSGAGTKRKKEESEVEDDIEEISSTSQDTNGSDEDWTT